MRPRRIPFLPMAEARGLLGEKVIVMKPRIFFVDAVALNRLGRCGTVEQCARLQTHLGLPQRMPFLVDPDGRPLHEINRWLRELPMRNSRSPNTWEAYAEDSLDWYRFMHGRGVSVFDATRDDLAAYHTERLLGTGDPSRNLKPASWNRKISALDNLYHWAVDEGLLARVPFTYKDRLIVMPDGRRDVVRSNMARVKGGRRSATVKWLEDDYVRLFLEVGISGLAAGNVPPSCGRHTARNRAMAELLVGTGVRIQEATHLLMSEAPDVPTKPVRYVRMDLPAPICKGSKARWILVPPSALRHLHGYRRMERNAVLSASAPRWQPDRPLEVTSLAPDGGHIDGRRRRWDTLTVFQRRRLVQTGGGSPLLFLEATGAPMLDWDRVFREATERCRRVDPYFPTVTPHTLRHTFAVRMLRWLIEQVARAVERKERNANIDVLGGYWRVHDPILTLRDLLGHASVTTTEVYLDAIDATQLYAGIKDDIEDQEDS